MAEFQPGVCHPKQHRSPGLPSDAMCSLCGGVIESGETCIRLQVGTNAKGEFDQSEGEEGRLACQGCIRQAARSES